MSRGDRDFRRAPTLCIHDCRLTEQAVITAVITYTMKSWGETFYLSLRAESVTKDCNCAHIAIAFC